MSHTRAIAHNTITQIVSKVFSTLLGLLAVAMMTRYLGTEKFGWYITTVTFLQFVGIISDFGLTIVTSQMMSEPNYEKTKLFKNLISYRFFSALLFFVLSPTLTAFFPYPEEVKTAIWLSSISFFCIAINQVFIGFYQSKLKMYIQVIGELTGRLVLVAGIWLAVYKDSGFMPIMAVIVLSSISYTLIMWLWAKKDTAVGFDFDWKIWQAITQKMWPIAVAVIFNVIYLRGDTILLSFFRSQSEVGIYGAAYRVIDIYSQLAMMIMGVITPLLTFYWSRNLKDEFSKYYQQAFDAVMLLAVPILVATLILAKKIMIFVAGQEFSLSGVALQILSLAVFGVYIGAIFGHTIVAINKQKQAMWVYITDAILTLIGYLIFIPRFGMYGAAWMTVFSEFYAGIGLFLIARTSSKSKIKTRTLGKIIAASLIMGVIIYLTRNAPILILVVIGGAAYILSLIILKAISKETLQEIFSKKNLPT